MSFEPYQPPAESRDARPAAIRWFRVYAVAMAMLSLVPSLLVLTSRLGGAGADTTTVVSLVALSVLLASFYAVAAFVPFKPWGWSWALAAIALGVISGGALFAVPLLFFWFQPRLKAAFARL